MAKLVDASGLDSGNDSYESSSLSVRKKYIS